VTQTGGLPYHGGPGSNYMTHSLAALAETLRADPGTYGLASGVGMHMQKHAYGVWSTEPGPLAPPQLAEPHDVASRLVESPEGAATVATYSVVHGRDGDPQWAALVCDVPLAGADGGARCYARLSDTEALAEAERTELVGQKVTLVAAEGHTEARL